MILLEILETRSRHFETVEGSNTYLEVVESEKLSNIYCVGSVSRERSEKEREREEEKEEEEKRSEKEGRMLSWSWSEIWCMGRQRSKR